MVGHWPQSGHQEPPGPGPTGDEWGGLSLFSPRPCVASADLWPSSGLSLPIGQSCLQEL